jgi:hypothetical protein
MSGLLWNDGQALWVFDPWLGARVACLSHAGTVTGTWSLGETDYDLVTDAGSIAVVAGRLCVLSRSGARFGMAALVPFPLEGFRVSQG